MAEQHENPNAYELIDQLYNAIFNSPAARKDTEFCREAVRTLSFLRWTIDSLENQIGSARREAAEQSSEAELYQFKIDEIYATWDATQTGYRDLADLAYVIRTAVA